MGRRLTRSFPEGAFSPGREGALPSSLPQSRGPVTSCVPPLALVRRGLGTLRPAGTTELCGEGQQGATPATHSRHPAPIPETAGSQEVLNTQV